MKPRAKDAKVATDESLIHKTLANFAPFARGSESWCVGVSGGRDSVALLHLLVGAGFQKLIVCHLDHGLRAESDGDAEFVAALAKKLKLPAVIAREDIAARAARDQQSIETAAREARYAFFARVAREQECPRLILGHHADDQAETFLFHLFRGSAAAGLSAMRPLTTRVIEGVSLQIARPLLGMWREEIEAYISAHALAFREDPSNADLAHTRNRLRHEVMPALERAMGRDVRRAVWRAAEIMRGEDDFLSAHCAALFPANPAPELDARALRALPLALQRRLIHAWLRRHAISNAGFEVVEGVRDLLTSRRAKINLPGARYARRRAGRLFIE